MKRKYEIVIILCPSESKTLNNEYSYSELDEDKNEKQQMIYLGGRIRMQAAVDIWQNVSTFIVVGGNKNKVDDMKNYLIQEIEKEKKRGISDQIPNIIRVESESDTNGNLKAIRKILKDNEKFKKKKVWILTNFYHLLRALRFASDIFPEKNFTPLAAEAVIQKHHPIFSLYVQEFLLRVASEINGLRDWENNRYKNQDKMEESDYKGICYDEKLLKNL